MKIEGEHLFNGSREEVWALVRDPEVLASLLPGTTDLKQLSESEYEGSITLRIGPVTGAFSGKIIVEDENPPESCSLVAEGEGKPGFFKGTGDVELLEQDGGTLMKYGGEIQIGGKLAGVGQRLIDMTSKSMIKQGMKSLDKVLAERTGKE
ncbi:MAG: carbon monoxide dehydrogenase subunit G [Anaerolineales bacterium]|nr:carbon monoxide dehydrogenase subunit G [Anaerolineales bacterium]